MSAYEPIGCRHWMRAVSGKADPVGCALADRHYSRRKVGAPQFMPPGETIVLVSRTLDAVWGWWRPHPSSGIKAMNGFDGWTCVIFRNESEVLSSELVIDAEEALKIFKGEDCGPSGMLTYVFDKKIRSSNPGACYRRAGWRRHPERPRSADNRKTLLWKPYALAGVWPPSSFR